MLVNEARTVVDARRHRLLLLSLNFALNRLVALLVVLWVRNFGRVWLIVTFNLMLPNRDVIAFSQNKRPLGVPDLALIVHGSSRQGRVVARLGTLTLLIRIARQYHVLVAVRALRHGKSLIVRHLERQMATCDSLKMLSSSRLPHSILICQGVLCLPSLVMLTDKLFLLVLASIFDHL